MSSNQIIPETAAYLPQIADVQSRAAESSIAMDRRALGCARASGNAALIVHLERSIRNAQLQLERNAAYRRGLLIEQLLDAANHARFLGMDGLAGRLMDEMRAL